MWSVIKLNCTKRDVLSSETIPLVNVDSEQKMSVISCSFNSLFQSGSWLRLFRQLSRSPCLIIHVSKLGDNTICC